MTYRSDLGAFLFIVRCHGAVDEFELPQEMGIDHIHRGAQIIAFLAQAYDLKHRVHEDRDF